MASALTQQHDKPKIGRPRKWDSVEELQQGIDAYFASRDAHTKPYTMAGLARALGCGTSTLKNYSDEQYAGEPFVEAIKSAKQRVEEYTEERLFMKGHPAGPIFSLKNNFGWKDEQQVTHTHEAVYTLRSVSDERLFEPPAIDAELVSPAPAYALAPSPADQIAVSEARAEAKAPPNRGVSPADVA